MLRQSEDELDQMGSHPFGLSQSEVDHSIEQARREAAVQPTEDESAVAMSVHKSQGSEFDEVDLVLGDRSSPIMTRELFYTGVTRARTAIRVFASVEAIRTMMSRRIVRESGLPDRLWSD